MSARMATCPRCGQYAPLVRGGLCASCARRRRFMGTCAQCGRRAWLQPSRDGLCEACHRQVAGSWQLTLDMALKAFHDKNDARWSADKKVPENPPTRVDSPSAADYPENSSPDPETPQKTKEDEQ